MTHIVHLNHKNSDCEHINEKWGGPYHGIGCLTKASSVTHKIWQQGAKVDYCYFANVNRIVNRMTNIIQNESKHFTCKCWLENLN